MDLTLETNSLRELVTSSNKIVILLPQNANKDMIAGALSLYLSFLELQKNVGVIYAKEPIVDWSNLIGVNKLTKNLDNKNFVISLDYIEGSIEKVSYNITGNKFNLVIEPKANAPQFNEKNVKYTHSGFSADLIFTVGAANLQDLGKYYQENPGLFTEKSVVTIANNSVPQGFGKVNFMFAAASVSEIIANVIKSTELPINPDIATNLYDGIISGSKNFSQNEVSADTYEAAAWCLRLGARKNIKKFGEEKPLQELVNSAFLDKPQTPPDWLKPKIYKGSTLL
jgi:nanoRNase/pAp phosphatase (c-di-AMP/oligoRNAs hydrolase)